MDRLRTDRKSIDDTGLPRRDQQRTARSADAQKRCRMSDFPDIVQDHHRPMLAKMLLKDFQSLLHPPRPAQVVDAEPPSPSGQGLENPWLWTEGGPEDSLVSRGDIGVMDQNSGKARLAHSRPSAHCGQHLDFGLPFPIGAQAEPLLEPVEIRCAPDEDVRTCRSIGGHWFWRCRDRWWSSDGNPRRIWRGDSGSTGLLASPEHHPRIRMPVDRKSEPGGIAAILPACPPAGQTRGPAERPAPGQAEMEYPRQLESL